MVGLLPTGDQPVPMSLAITRELELVGSFRFNDEIDEVIAALADGSLVVDPVVTHEFDVADAFERLRGRPRLRLVFKGPLAILGMKLGGPVSRIQRAGPRADGAGGLLRPPLSQGGGDRLETATRRGHVGARPAERNHSTIDRTRIPSAENGLRRQVALRGRRR